MNNISAEKQCEILMRATYFADEAGLEDSGSGGQLRKQMYSELLEKLKENRPLRVYLGVDPTGTDLHVGHFVPLQKLKKFQDLGHQVIFLIGDYTAMIGDPSERTQGREKLTHEQVIKLSETYTEQAFRILDPEKTEVRYNGEWLAKLNFADLVDLASIFSLKQIISRRDFQARMEKGESLRFHEALYSLMQGYDAYMLDCDVQVGAYDQHFNMLAGRNIQAYFGKSQHVMLTNPLIVGTDGRKMSKTYNNTINVKDEPFDMFGKTMRISDDCIKDYLELTSSLPPEEIDSLMQQLESGQNPMDVKKVLARNLVQMYHGLAEAGQAEEKFKTVVQQKSAPGEIPEIKVPAELLSGTWIDLLAGLALTKSKGEARRLIQQGGFYVEQDALGKIDSSVSIPAEGVMIRLGKRRYYRLVVV